MIGMSLVHLQKLVLSSGLSILFLIFLSRSGLYLFRIVDEVVSLIQVGPKRVYSVDQCAESFSEMPIEQLRYCLIHDMKRACP